MIEELMLRLDQLGRQLTLKEQELSHATARGVLLAKELARSQEEKSLAQDELQKEAFRCSLLEQRLNDLQREHQQLAGGLHNASEERVSLEHTLTVVQDELARAQQELLSRTQELQEQRAYFQSMMEAKEASIGSLQQLLTAQQRVAQEQQQLWEEEKAALKQALVAAATAAEATPRAPAPPPPPPPAPIYIHLPPLPPPMHDVRPLVDQQQAAAEQRQQQEATQQAAALKQRVLDLEADNLALTKRVTHLESHLRERERLLVKADKRYQELSRQVTLASDPGGLLGPAAADAAARTPAEAPHTMAAALGRLREVSLDRRAVQLQLELIQEAFEEEVRKRDKLRDKLGSKLASKAEAVAVSARETEALRLQLSRVEQQLASSREEAAALHKQLEDVQAKRATRASQQLGVLKSELQDMQARHQTAIRALKAAQEATLSQEQKRHAAQIRDLESQVQRLMSGGGTSLEEQATSRLLQSKLDSLQSDLQERSQQAQQLQHSLYLLRAHWGGLKRLLIKLQHVMKDGAAARAVLGQAAGLGLPGSDVELKMSTGQAQGEDLTAPLMRDWDPSQSKSVLDSCVEEAMMAGCQVLQLAVQEWQAFTHQAQHVSASVSAATAAQQANSATIQPLLSASQLQLRQAQDEAAEAQRAVVAERAAAAAAGERLADAYNTIDQLQRELDTQKEVVSEYQKSAAQMEGELKQTKQALKGAKGDQDAALLSRDAQLHAAQRTIDDLKSNVGVLHLRLEHMQANFAQVDTLKARLSSMLATVPAPSLVHHHAPLHNTDPNTSYNNTAHDLVHMLNSVLQGTASVSDVKKSLSESVEANSKNVQQRIEAALSEGLESSKVAVAACALLETQQWELERGMEGVGLLRAQLKALHTEVSAGRVSTAQVVLQGLITLLDTPLSTSPAAAPPAASHTPAQLLPLPSLSSAPAASKLPGSSVAGQAGVQEGQLLQVLSAARQATASVTSHAKTVAALLLAVKQALPEWVQLTRAEALSQHRSDLSRAKAEGSQQLAGQVAGSAAGLARARAAADRYMAVVQEEVSGIRKQVDDALAAGALPLDTPLRSQLDALSSERQRAAAQLTALLQPPSRDHHHNLDTSADETAAVELPEQLARASQAVARVQGPAGVKEAAGEGRQASDPDQSWAIPVGAPSSNTQIVLSRPGQVKSLDQINHLQGAVSHLHADKTQLEQDRRALLQHLTAIRRRAELLVEAVQAVLPIPEDLVLGLQDGLVGWLDVAPRAGDEVVGREGEAGEEQAADRLMEESAGLLKQLVRSFLQQVEAAAHHAAQEQVQTGQVAPLAVRCGELEVQLQAAGAEIRELQEQVVSLVKESAVKLEEARDACITAANTAFETALDGLRQEVQAVESEVLTIKEAAAQALEVAADEWAVTAAAAATSASQAVTALKTLAERLQGQLAAELKAHEATRAQFDEASRAAAQESEKSEAEFARAKSQLEVTRQQLSYAEAGQEASEKEADRLRQTLRQYMTNDRGATVTDVVAVDGVQPASLEQD